MTEETITNEMREAIFQSLRLLTIHGLRGTPSEPKQRLTMMADLLGEEFSLSEIDTAVKTHLRESCFFPQIAEMREYALAERLRRESKAQGARQRSELDFAPTETGSALEAAEELLWSKRYRSREDYEEGCRLITQLSLEASRRLKAIGNAPARCRYIAHHDEWRAFTRRIGYEPFLEFDPEMYEACKAPTADVVMIEDRRSLEDDSEQQEGDEDD